jgi:short-subunit dehydrogenase
MDVKDKVAVITGASSGIGKALALLLSKNGAKIALVARSEEKLEELSKKLPDSFVYVADMANEDEIRKMIKEVKKHFGRIDILVNNAGRGYDAPVEKMNIKTFRDIFDLDLVGPLIAMQEVIPIMKKQQGGTIVNISSGTALMYLPNMSGYSSVKRALVGISLTAREELKNDKIIVSVVYPYITLTDFEKNTIRAGSVTEDFEDENEDGDFRSPDTAEYIAQKILDGIENEEAEIYAHDWMKNMG